MSDRIQITLDMAKHVADYQSSGGHLDLRRAVELPGVLTSSAVEGASMWIESGVSASAPARSPYTDLSRPERVLSPAGKAEPDVLARFAGIMSEVFPGLSLEIEDIDRALSKVRKRD